MAHVHAEVEKPPIDDTHLAPVRRFPTGATAPAGMVDAHPPCRPGRYCRYAAHPKWYRPLLHDPKLRAGAASAASGSLPVKPQADSMIDSSHLTESHEAPRAKRPPESGLRF